MSTGLVLWGHGNCARIPRLTSYEDAKAHYEKVVPLRGRNPELKPLGSVRRFTWYEIRENIIANQAENMEYKTYACNLYGKDVVEYFPNGDIVLDTNGWSSSITTGAFINFCIGDVGSIISESGKWYFVNNAQQSFLFKRTMRIRKDAEGFYEPTEITEDKVYRVNRKAMNAIRNKYRPILDYGKTMLNIDNKVVCLAELEIAKLGLEDTAFVPYYSWQAQNVKGNRAKWFALADKQLQSGDLNLLYDLVRCVAVKAGNYHYQDSSYTCYPFRFTELLEEMMKFEFRDEVFIAESLPYGERSADRNKRYFIK
jgi:hypothetical protein